MKNNKRTIAIAGIEGSFSEEAAVYYAQRNSFEPEMFYATTAEDTLLAALGSDADIGIIALENSNGGVVYETIYAAAKHTFHIEEIFEIDIKQNLLVAPGTRAEDIEKITSHQQALAQCKMYLKRKWPTTYLEEYPDTALAAKDLAAGTLPKTTAVVASSRAAKIFDLEVLEPAIQDLKFNFTSFLVVKK